MQYLTTKFNPSLGASANMNSTRSGLNAEDDDIQTFADATNKPVDSDSDNETMRENPKNGRTFNSGNRSQGAYSVPPPLPNLPPIQPARHGDPGGPGGPPPGLFWQPPWGGQWGGPPPPQRPPFMPQQQKQWAGYPPSSSKITKLDRSSECETSRTSATRRDLEIKLSKTQ